MTKHATQTEIRHAEHTLASSAELAGTLAEDPAPEIRALAATALAGRLPLGGEAIGTLERLLIDASEEVRYSAALSAATAPKRLRDGIILRLADESPRVRRVAAEALSTLDDPLAMAALETACLSDTDEPTAILAARAIGRAQAVERFQREVVARLLPCPPLTGSPPPPEDWEAEWPEEGGIAGGFMRCGMIEEQGSFQFVGAQSAWPCTVARVVVWESALGIEITAYETDADYQPSERDGLTITLDIHRDGRRPWQWLISPAGTVDTAEASPVARSAVRHLSLIHI